MNVLQNYRGPLLGCAIILSSFVLTACQSNPLESKISLRYVGENGKSLELEAVSGALADNVSGVKADYELSQAADGTQTLKISLDGSGNNTNSTWLDRFFGFLSGLFAAKAGVL